MMCMKQLKKPLRIGWAAFPGLVLVLLSVLFGPSGPVNAQAMDNEDMPWFREHPDKQKFAVILTGAAATDDIRRRFRQWSIELHDVLVEQYGYDQDHVILLLDDGENTGDAGERVNAGTSLDEIHDAFDALRSRVTEGDQVNVYMIGHGTSSFGEAKFNNVGPDITGEEFAAILDGFSAQDVVVINTTSASFEFSRALSAPGRIIISATRSRAERYDPIFAGYLIQGLDEHAADIDRNGRVSLLELFNYASRNVARWYDEAGRLSTETAVMDDTGNGMFSREPGPRESDGLLAEIAYVDAIQADDGKQSPEALAVRGQMQELERSIVLLRGQKDNYLENDYWSRLETLLVDLARATRRYNALP